MGGVLWLSVLMIGLVLICFVAVAQVKKRLFRSDDTLSAGFTLADLRALHRSGQMSDAEFEKAKEAVVAAARRAAERLAQQQKQQQQAQPLSQTKRPPA